MSMLSLYEYPTRKEKFLGWITRIRFKLNDDFLIETPIILWVCLIILLLRLI